MPTSRPARSRTAKGEIQGRGGETQHMGHGGFEQSVGHVMFHLPICQGHRMIKKKNIAIRGQNHCHQDAQFSSFIYEEFHLSMIEFGT